MLWDVGVPSPCFASSIMGVKMSVERIPRSSVLIWDSAKLTIVKIWKKGQAEFNSLKADLPALSLGLRQMPPYGLDWVVHSLSWVSQVKIPVNVLSPIWAVSCWYFWKALNLLCINDMARLARHVQDMLYTLFCIDQLSNNPKCTGLVVYALTVFSSQKLLELLFTWIAYIWDSSVLETGWSTSC